MYELNAGWFLHYCTLSSDLASVLSATCSHDATSRYMHEWAVIFLVSARVVLFLDAISKLNGTSLPCTSCHLVQNENGALRVQEEV